MSGWAQEIVDGARSWDNQVLWERQIKNKKLCKIERENSRIIWMLLDKPTNLEPTII
jgi:hypothetical protein